MVCNPKRGFLHACCSQFFHGVHFQETGKSSIRGQQVVEPETLPNMRPHVLVLRSQGGIKECVRFTETVKYQSDVGMIPVYSIQVFALNVCSLKSSDPMQREK